MSQINFNATKEEDIIITKIVSKAKQLKLVKSKEDQSDLMMDLTATHCNGTPLDFEKLLSFDDFNFSHDILGIMNYIDRTNGNLTRNFLPRCSK